MMTNFDVVVIGGGAIGSACARELALSGRKVLVVEEGGDKGQAWRAAAGLLAPQIEADGDSPLVELGLGARDLYDRLGPALQMTTGIDIGLWREGIARIATDQGEIASLQSQVAWQRAQGYTVEWIDAAELRSRWPWTGPALGALWAPEDGALDPSRLVQALVADAERLGATIVTDRVRALRKQGGRVVGVDAERSDYSAPQIVIAAGAWSSHIAGIPRSLPVQPVRGQMMALPWPAGVERAILYHKDCYLLARGTEAILGSTMEYVGYRPEVTQAGLTRILSVAVALCPALMRAKVRRSWAGLRPVTPDGLPIIGEEPVLEGLWYATGHGRNGILLAAMTGVLLTQLLDGREPTHNMNQFAPDRFDTAVAQ
ncbi:MAG TPA: glycine oxidase ThiO [Gemmatimonadales bacterium]|nr:glycine oxidase ThiO [Gemmatimonadales bacterium]